MTTEIASQGNILIVDDAPANLDLLAEILKQRRFKARRVLNGRAALKAAEADPPDLILLDINLPDLDGYTVCRQLKSMPALCDTPVIFISALTETIDKVKAFACGGVDYVTKPIQVEEVEARIGAQLRLRRLQQELEEKNNALADSLESIKTMEELRDNLVHMVVHDIRSPLSAVLMALAITLESTDELPPKVRDHLRIAMGSVREVTELAASMLDINRMETGKMPLTRRPQDLAVLVGEAIESTAMLARVKAITVKAVGGSQTVCVDGEVLRRVLVNLLNNAIKFTPREGTVTLEIAVEAGMAVVRTTDQGPGIPAELRELVFRKFGDDRLRRAGLRQSVGLGLAFCKMAIEAHEGQIGVDSEVGRGSCFWFKLPTEKVPETAFVG